MGIFFRKGGRENKMTAGGIVKISVKAEGFMAVRRTLEEISKIKENHPEVIEVDIEVVL